MSAEEGAEAAADAGVAARMLELDEENLTLQRTCRMQQDEIDELRDEIYDLRCAQDSSADNEEDVAAAPATPPAESLALATVEIRKARQHTVAMLRAIRMLQAAAGLPAETDPTTMGAGLRNMAVAELRHLMRLTEDVVRHSQSAVEALSIGRPLTSRARYLQPLAELIGPPPATRTWEDEWIALNVEAFAIAGRMEYANEFHVKMHDTPERLRTNFSPTIDDLLRSPSWTRERAELYVLLGTAAGSISRALRGRDSCYVASTYALCEALFESRPDSRSKLPPRMFRNMLGECSLMEAEPNWKQLEHPDETGFCGLTSMALTLVDCMPQSFTETGFAVRVATKHRVEHKPAPGDVVAFDSAPDDEHGAHTAITTTSNKQACFPPNTQYRLKEVFGAGEWEAPGGKFPQQRLLVVTATYHPPRSDVSGKFSQLFADQQPKLCGSREALIFGRPEACALGLDGLADNPMLSMADEFARDLEWTTWEGAKYTLRGEYEYVTGSAVSAPCGASGTRDEANDGKTLADFQAAANAWIADRRRKGLGSIPGESALLTRDEVLAVRLITGPAHHPINGFLRQTSKVVGEHRRILAQHPSLTFAATVGHVCRALRKLSDVASEDEISTPLWRGMRGAVPSSFWEEDSGFIPTSARQGVVVEPAFMSTSRLEQACVDGMQADGPNVLWVIQPQPATAGVDCAFHSGASVSILSQFAHEDEVLFAPGTMLRAKPESTTARASAAFEEAGKKRYRTIKVVPSVF